MVMFFNACSDSILEEQPRGGGGSFTPDFFETDQGFAGGLTSLYLHTRYIFGSYGYAAQNNGTDEYTYAQSADGNFNNSDFSSVSNYQPGQCRSDVIWNNAFSNINTANGLIENGIAGGVSDALIAEARFFRAWDYLLLVTTFGGVPLDFGSGELAFNTNPARTSVRNTVTEVYTKVIFPDLLFAYENLPVAGRVTGGITKTAARLYLSKAYLSYAWWLENPKDMPTYPLEPRTDPNGRNAAWYFQQAYDMAIEGIKNPGPFGLLDYYYDIHLGSNDRNKEIVLYSDRVFDSYYNAPLNDCASWFATFNYPLVRSRNVRAPGDTVAVSTVYREACQWGGRPWTRMAPPIEVFTKTFADKKNDSRYDGTFVTVYPANWQKSPSVANIPSYLNANNLPIYPGDPVLTFLDEDNPDVVYPSNNVSAVGGGVLPGRSDWVINPSGISRVVYPGLWKIGTYRTDHDTKTSLGLPDQNLTRPWNYAKFSEFYFFAAEAAVKGANAQAGYSPKELINVIRARAGKWRWHNNGFKEKIEDNSAAMIAATPENITIEYILAERSREYFGEGYRWYDLVRTQTWHEIAKEYTICGTAMNDHTPVKVTRTIEKKHYLRPIPSGQIDRLMMTDDEKKAYQNPGY